MKNKGFTLIELLAVIVILAIIALIATPIILNIINDSKEESNKRSVELYGKAVEQAIAKFQLNGSEIPAGDLSSTFLETVQYSGSEVTCTTNKLYEDGSIYLAGCKVGTDTKEYTYGIEQLVKGKFDSLCTPSKEQLYSTTPLTEGYKYDCKVNPNKESYSFFVLEDVTDSSKQIKLIMDSNIRKNGNPIKEGLNSHFEEESKWVTPEDYLAAGGTDYSESEETSCKNAGVYCADNLLGPITAMNFLNIATTNWTNLKKMTLNAFGNDITTSSEGKIYNIYARLPFSSELSDYTDEKAYLYEYLAQPNELSWGSKPIPNNSIENVYGYWAADSRSLNTAYAIYLGDNTLHGNGLTSLGIEDASYTNESGIRPVIILDL